MEPNEIQMGLAAAVEEVLETMCFASVLASGEGTAPASSERDLGGGEGTLAASGDGAAPASGGRDSARGEGAAPAEDERTVPAFGDEAVAADPDAAVPACTAELRFHGDPSGQCRLRVPWNVARILGAGFLGCEETDVSDFQTEGVVCELANMICGSVLSRLEGGATFQITHPELVPPERGAGFEGAGINRWFDLGDGMLTVSLELQRTV